MKKLLNKLVAGLIVALVALAICAVLSVIITLSGMLVVGGIDYLFKCELPLKKNNRHNRHSGHGGFLKPRTYFEWAV